MNENVRNVVISCEAGVLTKYQRLESRHGFGVKRRLINGRVTGSNKCVGYCAFQGHPGFLSKEQRKAHNCIVKQCLHYTPKKGAPHEVRIS